MKAYLFGSIFYEKDIEYNKTLLAGIRKAYPGIDIYAPQEAPFNDKRTCGDSTAIFQGDYNRLKETDLLIGCLDGDTPPIGSVTECGIFCEMARHDPNKHIVVLHTDSRDGYKTASMEKYYDLEGNQCHSQMNYFNLFTAGAIESCGVIVGTKDQLFEYVHELYLEHTSDKHNETTYVNADNYPKSIGWVSVYNSKMEWIGHYDSVEFAAKNHNVSPNLALASYCSDGHFKAGGLYFIPTGGVPHKSNGHEPVYCYDKRTRKYICCFGDAVDTAISMNCSIVDIQSAARGENYYCNGFIWSYLKFDKIPAGYLEINREYWNDLSSRGGQDE